MALNVLGMVGLVRVSDLAILTPDILEAVEGTLRTALSEEAQADTLQKEAETKLKTAAARKKEAARKLAAVARFRQAMGEK